MAAVALPIKAALAFVSAITRSRLRIAGCCLWGWPIAGNVKTWDQAVRSNEALGGPKVTDLKTEDVPRELIDAPGWHTWLGIAGLCYGSRNRSSPAVVLRAGSAGELRQKIDDYNKEHPELVPSKTGVTPWGRPLF